MAADCTYFDKDTIVRGNLTTSDLIIEGSFQGEIRAKGSVMLKKTVRLNANIRAREFLVEEGADYQGSLVLTNGRE